MRVKSLIAKLQQLDKDRDLEVFIRSEDEPENFVPVGSVIFRELEVYQDDSDPISEEVLTIE